MLKVSGKILIISFFCWIAVVSVCLGNVLEVINTTTFFENDTIQSPKDYVKKADWLLRVDQEKSLELFRRGETYFLETKDTLNFIKSRLGLAEIEKRNGHYYKAFQILWKTEPIAKEFGNPSVRIKLKRMLGVLYGFYGKEQVSLDHLIESLDIAKSYLEKKQLSGPYLAIARQYISQKNFVLAEKYLDSSYVVNTTKKRLIYADAYYAHVYTQQQDLRKASIYFKNLIPQFEKQKASFLPIVYDFYGDFKYLEKEKDSTVFYYKKAISSIDNIKAHLEIKPAILNKLSNIEISNGDTEKAFKYLKEAKEVSDSLFNTLSGRNKELLEITDNYQKDLIVKEEQLAIQKKLQLLQNKSNFRLKIIVGILSLLMVAGFLIYKLRGKIQKVKDDKEAGEILLKSKNKELTGNALQIIEKDQAVNELLEIIQEKSPQDYQSLRKKYTKHHKKIWEDFHLKFTNTNSEFYKKLLELHPELTSNDLKHCALIKLQFDSKEMSHILGISLHSVHVARSRLRKKMKLERSDSLGNYLSSF